MNSTNSERTLSLTEIPPHEEVGTSGGSNSCREPPAGPDHVDTNRDDAGVDKSDGDDGDGEVDPAILERGLWDGRCDFFLSAMGYAVGLGNVWRFPYLCFKHGGGAFLLVYFIFLILGGIPLVLLELSVGQYTSLGPTLMWNAAPLFRGAGITMVLVSAVVAIYYNVVIAWSLFYFFGSMQTNVPWSSCENEWNTPSCCVNRHYLENCSQYADVDYNLSCLVCLYDKDTFANFSRIAQVFSYNETTGLRELDPSNESLVVSPSEEYFYNHVLKLSDSPSHFGQVQWPLLLCLLAIWICVFLCLIRGIKTSGKVVYFTAILPYAVLLVLLVQSARLPGAKDGVIYYLRPDWSRLADSTVWRDAATQVIFSLGICFGGMVTLGSYNRLDKNCYRDAIMISFGDTLTSIFAGFVVFTTLGNMAYTSGLPIENVVGTGVGFAFVVFPEALSNLQGPTAMSVLFFFLLVTLGIDSQVISVHTLTQALVDEFPTYLRKRKIWVLLATCCLLFVLGIPMTSQAGLYIVQILDIYVIGWPVLIIGLLECVVFTWIYGYRRLSSDIWTMIGKRPGTWWRFLWQGITPLIFLFVLVLSVLKPKSITYDSFTQPIQAQIGGWVLAAIFALIVPVWGIVALIRSEGSFVERFKKLLKPSSDWGCKWGIDESLWTIPEYMRSDKEEPQPPFRKMSSMDESSSRQAFPVMGQDGENIDTGSIAWSEDENKIRGNWTGRYDFLISTLGYSVGIGNVWRFPYLVYKNGGGAFFFPYVIILFLVGLPLVFVELAFGQFASCGPITIWRISPIFKGVGYASIATLFFVCTYYNVINAWSVYYLFASMQASLPWASCNNTWNTDKCRLRSEMNSQYDNCSFSSNDTIWPDSANGTNSELFPGWETVTFNDAFNDTSCVNITENTSHLYNTPSFEYFFNAVLGLSDGIDNIGTPQWHLSLCLLGCWTVTFVSLIKGVKSAGKVVYITVSFPYIVLFVLLVRYATLDSEAYLNGLKYYVTPQWERLGDAAVWGDAASQVFFSLGLSQGGLIALSSYNRFHYDCYRDAYIVCLVDTLTSVFAGFVIFAILGVMAKESGVGVNEVVESSFALAYVAYPEAVTKLPGSTLWAILFFLMLFSLAVDSEFLMVESIVAAIIDEYPDKLAKRRIWVILTLCVLMFILGLPMVCKGGMYILVLMDVYASAWAPLIIGFCLCMALSWVYKVDNFQANIKAMLGNEPSFWWKLLWKYITPLLLLCILIFQWARYEPPTLDGYVYPDWAHGLALLMSMIPPLLIPLYGVYQIIRNMKGCVCSKDVFRRSAMPESEWGPALEKHRNATYLPGVTPQEKHESIAQWIEKGQIFHTDGSKMTDVENKESALINDESSSPTCSDVSGSKSSRTGLFNSGDQQINVNGKSKDNGHLKKHTTTGKNHSVVQENIRRENTKGYNVTFPDDADRSAPGDFIYTKKRKPEVEMRDQTTQTTNSFLQLLKEDKERATHYKTSCEDQPEPPTCINNSTSGLDGVHGHETFGNTSNSTQTVEITFL